jgi:hypothetical protein
MHQKSSSSAFCSHESAGWNYLPIDYRLSTDKNPMMSGRKRDNPAVLTRGKL